MPSRMALLNPHGSDETCVMCKYVSFTENFLTHTVQMKLFFIIFYLAPAIAFLTHTVQMKPKKEVESIILKLLLNPHGSDETYMHM